MSARYSQPRLFRAIALWGWCLLANAAIAQTLVVQRPSYSIRLVDGEIPSLEIQTGNRTMFRVPVVSGLSTSGSEEKLS